MLKREIAIIGLLLLIILSSARGQDLPKILQKSSTHYLPDYSYAGYQFGEKKPSANNGIILNALDYGVIPDDGLDDTKSMQKVLQEAQEVSGSVTVQLPEGRIILSDILYIQRSNIVLRGAGSGENGTEIYCPRPMRLFPDPEPLSELREYLIELDKRQKEPANNIDLPFSQYAWAGGIIWVKYPDIRVKEYLDKYDEPATVLATILKGEQGGKILQVNNTSKIKEGDIVQIEWYNKDGEDGSLLDALYGNYDLKIGSHHWNYPNHALVRQRSLITKVSGNIVTIKDPLLLDIIMEWKPTMVEWKHLEEVGLEHFKITFPNSPTVAHHVEDGYNGIYLTRLFNGWVKDIKIENSDSGILTEEVSNITIEDIETSGEKLAHYSVAMSGVHNVLVKNLTVKNKVRHPLSFNTYSTKSVYLNCKIEEEPILDQHSGVNHQNLFDNIEVSIALNGKDNYPLFAGGGAGYWKPSHGAFTTLWNIKVHFKDGFNRTAPVVLDGMEDGPKARLVGIHANKPIRVEYFPDAYQEKINEEMDHIPSLYEYQLKKRLNY